MVILEKHIYAGVLDLEYRTVLKTVARKGLRDRSPSHAPLGSNTNEMGIARIWFWWLPYLSIIYTMSKLYRLLMGNTKDEGDRSAS